jgi:hypothetical protein
VLRGYASSSASFAWDAARRSYTWAITVGRSGTSSRRCPPRTARQYENVRQDRCEQRRQHVDEAPAITCTVTPAGGAVESAPVASPKEGWPGTPRRLRPPRHLSTRARSRLTRGERCAALCRRQTTRSAGRPAARRPSVARGAQHLARVGQRLTLLRSAATRRRARAR